MDLYISSLLLGATGLTAMALSGLGIHGHLGGSTHGHGHIGHGHTHGQLGHGHHGPGHASPGNNAHGHAVQHSTAAHHVVSQGMTSRALWAIASPRFLFSFALGFGAAGVVARQMLGGPLLAAAAVAGGLLLERVLVAPLWSLLMRFESKPAQTLESAATDEATAVTTFDPKGHGIVSIEVDGQIQQILATLSEEDRRLGVRIRAGQRVRIDDVDAERNRCTVSLL